MARSGGNTEFSLDLYIHNKLVALRINCINTGLMHGTDLDIHRKRR